MFIVHAVMQTSNWGGLELELSSDMQSVRVRDNYSQTEEELTCSEWIEIEYEGDNSVFRYNGETYNLNEFMVVGRNNDN